MEVGVVAKQRADSIVIMMLSAPIIAVANWESAKYSEIVLKRAGVLTMRIHTAIVIQHLQVIFLHLNPHHHPQSVFNPSLYTQMHNPVIQIIELLKSAIMGVAAVVKMHVDNIVRKSPLALFIEVASLENVRSSLDAHKPIGEPTMQTHINIGVIMLN
jgi:hypothetical protein